MRNIQIASMIGLRLLPQTLISTLILLADVETVIIECNTCT